MKIPKNWPTWKALERMLERDDNEGFCLCCGEEASSVEPDAARYTCEWCGEREVYGSHNVLMMEAFKGGNK